MRDDQMSSNRMLGYGLGAVYLLVGLVGFAVTGFDGFAATEGEELIVFELNPLHNIVHLAVGGMLLAGAAAGLRAARSMNLLVGSVYLAVGILGFFAIGREWNILALNTADNWLHIGSAAALLLVGMFADRPDTVRTHERTTAGAGTR